MNENRCVKEIQTAARPVEIEEGRDLPNQILDVCFTPTSIRVIFMSVRFL